VNDASSLASAPRRHPLNQAFEWTERAPAASRRISEAERRQFNDLGYVRLEGLFSAEAVAAVTAAIDPFEARAEAWLRERGGRVGIATADVITVTIHIAARAAAAKAFASQPAIKDVCHDLLGDDVRLYWDQSVYKKTARAQEVLWHQDSGYAYTEPQHYLTFWVPLTDVDEENGCPWIAPGLHRMAHRTGPNLKLGTVRKAYVLQYCLDGTVVVDPDGTRTAQDDPVRQFKVLERGR
jgi:ectoine hydroxylase-related dioxygenase (phytanoyl-CoA dioxygenase family)